MKHLLERYVDAGGFQLDIEEKKKESWMLHSWHPAVEMFEQEGPHGRHSWPATVFYALFYQVEAEKKPEPMRAR